MVNVERYFEPETTDEEMENVICTLLEEWNEFIIRLMNGLANINAAFKSVLPSFHWKDLCIGILAGVAFRLVVYYKIKNAKKYRTGVEYGSARWGTEKDIEPFVDWEDPDNNIMDYYVKDTHLPCKQRVNCVLGQFEKFYEIYDIDENSPFFVPKEKRLSAY